MSKFKPGALVMLVKTSGIDGRKYLGSVHTLGVYYPTLRAWGFNPILHDGKWEFLWTEPHMKLIDPGSGTDEMILKVGKPERTTEAA